MRMSMGSSLKLHSADGEPRKALAPGERQATVISVAAQKGGVGKTTTSLTLAAAWARYHDKRVLLVDLDPQGHVNVALRELIHVGGGALSDLLTEPTGLEVHEIATGTGVDDLFVTPADPHLRHAEDRMASRIGKELVLKKALEITRTHYDLIVIDCPPNVSTLTVNALVASDCVLIPSNPAALALSGVSGLIDTVHEVRSQLNPGLQTLGVVLTRLDGRNTKTNDAVLELVRENWGDLVLPVHIGVNDALSQAQLEGQDIYGYAPSSRGAKQYRELASCVLERIEG